MALRDRLGFLARLFVGKKSTSLYVAEADPLAETREIALRARKYYRGDADVPLTDRQRKWLKSTRITGFSFNICRTVINTTMERLRCQGFLVSGKDAKLAQRVQELVNRWWNERVSILQGNIYRQAAVDGITFVILDFEEDGTPIFVHHPLYIPAELGGDGYGVDVEFVGNNPNLGVSAYVLYWQEEGALYKTEYRKGIIARYRYENGEWVPDGEDAVRAYMLSADVPAPVPVAAFTPPEGAISELRSLLPLQDAYNKVWVDLLSAADDAAFRTPLIKGVVFTEDGKALNPDGSNALKLTPAGVLYTELPPDEVGLDVIPPADLSNLLNLEETILLRVSLMTGLPMTYITSSRQVASEGTLKQQEASLLARLQERRDVFGDAWEDIMRAAAVYYAIATGEFDPAAVMDLSFESIWASLSVRDELEQAKLAEAEARFGVNTERILRKYFGYSDQDIEDIKKHPEFAAVKAMSEMTVSQAEMSRQVAGGSSA